MYRHTQFGTAIVAGTVFALAGATVVVASLSTQTLVAAPWLVVALYVLIALAFVLFFRLTVVVDDEAVKAEFGFGAIRRVVPIADIRAAHVVRTRPWWGWGVRLTAAGWLYNVGGRHAVRLELKSARPVLIGSDEPETLKAAIDARLAAGR